MSSRIGLHCLWRLDLMTVSRTSSADDFCPTLMSSAKQDSHRAPIQSHSAFTCLVTPCKNAPAAGRSTERFFEACQKRLGLYLVLQNKSLHSQQRQLRTFGTLKSIFRLLEIGGRHPGDANLLPLQTSWHAHVQIHTQITTKHVTSRSVPAHPPQNHL
jgi:hypothetical protein